MPVFGVEYVLPVLVFTLSTAAVQSVPTCTTSPTLWLLACVETAVGVVPLFVTPLVVTTLTDFVIDAALPMYEAATTPTPIQARSSIPTMIPTAISGPRPRFLGVCGACGNPCGVCGYPCGGPS